MEDSEQSVINPEVFLSSYSPSACPSRLHSNDPARFQEDLLNIARTTLSSKLLTHHKDHFSNLAVNAIMRLKGSGNLEAIHIIKKLGGSLTDSYLDEGERQPVMSSPPRLMLFCLIGCCNVSADAPPRFPVGQEDRSEPTQEAGERQHPDRQHRHGHRQDQGTHTHTHTHILVLYYCILTVCVSQIFGSRVRVDSTAKVAEIELAEKEKMKEKVDRILKHGINCFINRYTHTHTHTHTAAYTLRFFSFLWKTTKLPLFVCYRQLIYNYPEQLFAQAGVMAIEHADFAGVERLALVTGTYKRAHTHFAGSLFFRFFLGCRLQTFSFLVVV